MVYLGLPIKTGDFPWRTVSHNQRVSIPMTSPWYLHGTWREKRGRCRAVVMTAVEVPRAVDIGLAVNGVWTQEKFNQT